MHTFLIIAGIVLLILLLIGLFRWWLDPDVGFFESLFAFDLICEVFEVIIGMFSEL